MDAASPAPTDRTAWPRILVAVASWGALFGLLWGLHAAADFVGPLFIAINLFIAAWPVKTALLKRGAHPIVATVALGLVVFVVLGLAMFALGWSVSALVRELPEYQSQFISMYDEIVALAASFGITEAAVLDQLQGISPSSIAGFVTSALSSVSGVVAALGVLVVMLFLMLLDAGSYPRRARALANSQPQISLALSDFVVGVRRYWVVASVFGLIVAVLDVAVLLIIGVPLAQVWGLVSFLTNYIPNVGFVIGIIPPVLMALLDEGPGPALAVIIAYSVINFVIQSIIQPKFNGDAVGVTALVSFLSLLVWSSVLGPIGALLGLPATLLLKALLIDHDPNMRWFNTLLASDVSTADPRGACEREEESEEVFVSPEEKASAHSPAEKADAEPVRASDPDA